MYEYLQYFTDVKVPLRQPEKPSVAVKSEDKEGSVSITAQHYKNALDKSLSYGERTKLFSELYYAYDEGDRATKKEVLYIIDAVIKKIKGNRLNQVGVTKLLIVILGYDTPAREELMDLVCDAQTSISEPLRAFIYTCLRHKVSWFTRFYPQDFRTIIEHRVTKETHPRRAIYIGPVEDEGGDFERDKAEFRKLLRAGYDVSYYEVRSFKEVVTALQEEKKSGAVELIIFAGHGKQGTMALGVDDPQSAVLSDKELLEGTISIMHKSQFIEYGLNDCLKKKGVVILNSCSTGGEEANAGVHSVANMLAEVFDQAAHVFAATKETKKCEIKLGKDKEVTGAEYDCPTYDAAEALRKLRKKPESAHIQHALAGSA